MTTNNELFVAQDFESSHPMSNSLGPKLIPSSLAAEIANTKFRQWAEGLSVVRMSEHYKSNWREGDINDPTHTARLAFIQPIEKAKCEHEPELRYFMHVGVHGAVTQVFQCRKCEKKLKATAWEAAGE